MSTRIFLTTLLLALTASSVQAAMTIVDDDFESYADDNALYMEWEPRNGIGDGPPTFLTDGILTSDDTLFPGLEGQGVDHVGGSVMQHTGLTPDAPIFPSASESVFVQGDIYVGLDGNSRTSIGLRNRTSTGNLLELGTYNSELDSRNPFELGGLVPEATTYAYRLLLFGGLGGDVVQEPNWYFFQFDTALDIDDTDPMTTEPTPDGIVGVVDIGAGWHTYSATFTPDTITLEMDLYRDGLDNGATLTSGSDVPGVDASVTYDITTGAQGFDSLRIGGPSGISSPNGVAFDNVSLSLIDVATSTPGDYDNSGAVGQGDLDLVLLNWGDTAPPVPAGWVNEQPAGLIGQAELDGVLLNWGNSALAGSIAGVPEPSTFVMALLLAVGPLGCRRRSS